MRGERIALGGAIARRKIPYNQPPMGGMNMPAALISVMDAKERARYAKQMDELVKLLRKNNDQVTKMAALMEKLVKAMGASAQ
jgi:hypothetical protein